MSTGLRTILVTGFVLVGAIQCLAGTEKVTDGVNDTVVDTAIAAPWCRVSVESLRVDNGQLYDTLDVSFETGQVDLAGYVLKLGLASHLLDVIEILPGEIIDSCGWEMFHANQIIPRPDAPQLSELWQITALAQIGMGAEAPVCFGFDRPVSLARLVVSSLHVPIAPDTSVAVFFYWEACRDNVLSDKEGASILVSDSVINSYPITIETEPNQFPTCHGTPAECISPEVANVPRRLVDFQNGGVEFRLRIDPPEEDSSSSIE